MSVLKSTKGPEGIDHDLSGKMEQGKDSATSVDVGTRSEAIEASEVVGTGEISENTTDGKDRKSGGANAGASDENASDIKNRLLKNSPNPKVMRSQVKNEIQKEVKQLHRRVMVMMSSPGEVSYHEMSNIVRKVRELRGLLASLLKISVEGLKTLWLRFVHGVV